MNTQNRWSSDTIAGETACTRGNHCQLSMRWRDSTSLLTFDDPALDEIYELCATRAKPLIIHASRQFKSPGYRCDPHELCAPTRSNECCGTIHICNSVFLTLGLTSLKLTPLYSSAMIISGSIPP